MPKQSPSKQDLTLNHANQEDPGAAGDQHKDWGQGQAGAGGNEQSAGRGNIGGVPGSQHNDWGHSPVETDGNGQSADAAGRKRQGVMPGEEMGHLRKK